MIRVNLLPYWEEKKKAGIKRQVVIIAGSVILFFLIIASLQLYMMVKIGALDKEVNNAEARLKKLTQITGDVEQYKRDKALLRQKLKVITDLEKNRMDPVYLLDEIASGVPEGKIWLISINQKGTDLKIGGMAKSNSAIALYMIKLKLSKYIESVDLISSKQVVFADVKLMDFMLSCTLSRG
jgi:type IV pilus assembly protein PilN